MVKYLHISFYILILLTVNIRFLEAIPIVDASIDSMKAQAHYPLNGTITITHDKGENIDAQSFKIDGKPLEVSFVQDVAMSASTDTSVAIYNFQLPALDKGLYILPEISVKIGGKIYHTTPSSYEVQETTTSIITPSDTPEPSSTLIFNLEAAVKGPSTLYPGERTKLFYRISYNHSIDLSRSDLPMIHPPHFKKVGDVQIRDYQEKNVTIQDLTQEVEASEIGTFQFGPSVIEGYAYNMNGLQKNYDPTLLQAKAPIVTVEVKSFPQANQPASFTGAIGKIRGEASLVSSSTVSVGDTVQVQVKVQGISNLADLRLPPLHCLPGFSGFFQMSDLPPLSEVKDNFKFFHIEIRPMTSLIHQIPSLKLSSFDPETNDYVKLQTDPISLTVQVHQLKKTFSSVFPLLTSLSSIQSWPEPQLSPLEIEGEPLELHAIKSSRIHTGWIFWSIPIGASLLILQKWAYLRRQQRPKIKIPKSEELLRKAFKQGLTQSSEMLALIERAFWSRLWENKRIKQGDCHFGTYVPTDLDPIRSFLIQLQALQYSPDKTFDFSALKKQAQQLFEKI